MSLAPRAPRRWLIGASVAAVLASGVLYGCYFEGEKRYAASDLRPAPRVPCAVLSGRKWRKEAPVSPSEPWQPERVDPGAPSGDPVWLTAAEMATVRCIEKSAPPIAAAWVDVLHAETPEARGQKLHDLVQAIPAPLRFDRGVEAAYQLSRDLVAKDPSPEVKAAWAELDQVRACRYKSRTRCPTRPPMPLAAVRAVGWPIAVAAAVSALVLLAVVLAGAVVLARRLWALRRTARRNPQAATSA